MRDNVATKEDLKQFATKDDLTSEITRLENKMDEGFSSLHSEIKSIQEKLDNLEQRLCRLEKTTFEDQKAFVKDFILLKKRVSTLEKMLEKNG
ncbi:MAG: hypothetical protein WC025_01350 [Candidatus Magasanikbacteria bacterium]